MHAILRPYATAGVVIAGTGLIAATPVVAPAPAVGTVVDVALTAGGSLASPWEEVFNTSSANATTLLNNFLLAPGVAWQQLYANVMGYTQQFLDDPSATTLADINTAIQEHWVAVRDGWSLPLDVAKATYNTVTHHTIDGTITTGHALLIAQVPGYLPAGTDFTSPMASRPSPISPARSKPFSSVTSLAASAGATSTMALPSSCFSVSFFTRFLS